jgi:hypothetical protein
MKPLLKTTSKSDVVNGSTRQHTRLLRPDGLTRPEYQMTRPTCQTHMSMTSSCHVSDTHCHVISRQPS